MHINARVKKIIDTVPASYPTAPSQVTACGFSAPGSSNLLTYALFFYIYGKKENPLKTPWVLKSKLKTNLSFIGCNLLQINKFSIVMKLFFCYDLKKNSVHFMRIVYSIDQF
jgi:hypothetical protein